MTNPVTHIAYSDESYQTASRYRSIALVTLRAVDGGPTEQTLGEIIHSSGISEFKWEKLRQARERFAALKMVDKTIELAVQGKVRVDVLIWDTRDSRHQIPGRNDISNLQRMYYHLFKNVLQCRWPRGSTWALYPDENTALDWATVRDFLDAAGTGFRIDDDLFEGGFRLRLERDFRVFQIAEVNSADAPLCQVADLFAGLGPFSYMSYDKYEPWVRAQNGELPLFDIIEYKASNRERERFNVMKYLDEQCKKYKLQVGLTSSRGFKTYHPKSPINFWLYTPQRPEDKAPVRKSQP